MERLRILNLSLVAAVLCFGMSACQQRNGDGESVNRGTGVAVEQTYDVKDFDVLQLSSYMYVTLHHGDAPALTIKADEAVFPMLGVSSRRGRLWIGIDDEESYDQLQNRNMRIDVDITYTNLSELMCTGAVLLTLADTLRSPNLEIGLYGASVLNGAVAVENNLQVTVIGASSLQLAYLEANHVESEVTGASSVELTGQARWAELAFVGSSVFKGEAWEVDSLTVSVRGASTATVNARHGLWAEARGASKIFYLGEPDTLEMMTTGASRIQQR
ncbi:MAG: DUF2807 domain-containing protein [Bacteroidales bacterium]|nr:DUF2807 domain-containing protein [Bacteroidales bacterium]